MTEVFPDEDYRFHLRFERGSVAEFFRPTTEREKILAERRRWLQTAPDTYAALLPDGIPLLEETIELARAEQVLPADFDASRHPTHGAPLLHHPALLALGSSWEPDVLLLKPDSAGRLTLVGA